MIFILLISPSNFSLFYGFVKNGKISSSVQDGINTDILTLGKIFKSIGIHIVTGYLSLVAVKIFQSL